MKKSFRKIPTSIITRFKYTDGCPIVVGCSQVYRVGDILSGKLKHLGIELSNKGLTFSDSIIPLAKNGKYSGRNINGYEIVRKDLPKETHYNSVETPNWGDSYNGTHTVDLPYEKYPRDFYAPQLKRIKISSPNHGAGQYKYVIIFEVDQVLDPKNKNFKTNLLECINFLQENVESCGIQKSGASVNDYIKSINVAWEVLPPGTKEDAIARIFHDRKPTLEEKSLVEERYSFLMSINPKKLIYGMSGIQRYFGGLINDSLVVFENISYGNAIM